ncbi:MAG: hypothetical protein ABFD25_20370 [Clostridiaceae bacterium]
MSEKSNASLDKEQEKISPQIEEEILELLEGDLKETALGFVAYLRTNQMTPRQWFGPNYWRIPYEKNYLCSIFMNKDKWRVFFFSGDYKGEFEEGFVKAVQDSVMPCVSCTGDDCPKGKEMTVFGKEFTNTCFQFPVQFVNPNGSTLEYIKELLEYWKEVAPHSDSWHAH